MGTKQFDNYADLITFTRASGATYLDSDGVLKTASTNIPRIEYDANGNRLGLLIEEQRTNLVTHSEDFSQSSWSKIRSSVAQSSIQAPDGTTSAFVVTPSAGLNTHYIADIVSGTSGSRSISFFAKKKEYSVVFVGHGIGAQEGTYFDLDAGAIASEGTDIDASTITSLPNGWYRCAVTFDSVIEPRYAILAPCESSGSTSFNADGSSGVYVWGAQLETGAFPTSYISTSGSTATRAADVASITGADFKKWFNPEEGTLYGEASQISSVSNLFALGNSTSDYILLRNRADGVTGTPASVQVNSPQVSFSNVTYESLNKSSFAYKINDFAVSVNGATALTDTNGQLPVVTEAQIGRIAGFISNCHIKSIKYYPRRLSNAQLQELTQ